MIFSIIQKIIERYRLQKYNDFNIAELFRKNGAEIGRDCRIKIRKLDDPYFIIIGNHCSISAGVKLLPHDGGGWIFHSENPLLQRFGKIIIRDNCYIGMNAIILPNVTIGPNSIVGAGSIVTKDVPPGKIVAGNPARIINDINNYKEKIISIWEKQMPKNYLEGFKSSCSYSAEEIYIFKNNKSRLRSLKKHLRKQFSI